MTSRYKEDDIKLLLPHMSARVQSLIDAMKSDGFEPVLFDGLRTPEEAVANAKKGTGIVASMHLFGCAADLICAEHGWACRAAKHKFYQSLKRNAIALGFVCGADFGSVDEPHVQGCFISDQAAIRALGTVAETLTERDAKVAAFFDLRDAAAVLKTSPTKPNIIVFQRAASLTPDGQYGPKTEAALKRALRAL